MVEKSARNSITLLVKKWRLLTIFSDLFIALAITCVLFMVMYKTTVLPYYQLGSLSLVTIFTALLIIRRPWGIKENELARFLDYSYPQLEESSALLLKPFASLNLLEKMQVAKIEPLITRLPVPLKWRQKLKHSLIALAVSLIVCCIITLIPYSPVAGSTHQKTIEPAAKNALKPKRNPATVTSVSVTIVPPAYTSKPSRQQESFDLLVEENAFVTWQVATSSPVNVLTFIFSDTLMLSLKPANDKNTLWSLRKPLRENGFYQVKADSNSSELYKIETIPDQLPTVKIKSPQPYFVVDFGEPRKVTADIILSDDYGIASAVIMATISSGSGEGVQFKEQQMPFTNFIAGRQSYRFSKLLDLVSMGLQPGDELYYYVKAVDNHGQENRSDIYIINMSDTTQLMSMEGMATGVNLVPEYFRSQRQIIIETEQLIRERDTIPLQQFNNRSNNLGLDQKLLRLRYGKFLGEESENEIGNDGDHDHDTPGKNAHSDERDFGNASAIMDAYTHKHDNAEDATFFEPALKAQLKETLTEMWKSELQLRTYKPRQALPFEYKALRLLKDLQQKSRVYVAKTSLKTTPLKPGTRLTGELDKIIEPLTVYVNVQTKNFATSIQEAMPVLENLKNGLSLENEEIDILKNAAIRLTQSGASSPRLYLEPLSALRRIISGANKPGINHRPDILLVQQGLQKLLPSPRETASAIPSKSIICFVRKLLSKPQQA